MFAARNMMLALNAGDAFPAQDNVVRSPNNMTGYTSGSITVSADTEIGATGRAWMAFNGSLSDSANNYWVTTNTFHPHWLKIDFGSDRVIYSVKICARTSGSYPRDFKIQSSDDNSAWTDRLSVSGYTTWAVATFRSWNLTTPASARYWTLISSAGPDNYLVIPEMQFLS